METLREYVENGGRALLRFDTDAMGKGWNPAESPYDSMVLDGYAEAHPELSDDEVAAMAGELLEIMGR